ncbi:MAG: FAD-dependent oxidoreductase [Alphaproteobacteria bacterium]
MPQSPADGLKLEPYWWDAAPPTPLPIAELPKQIDTVVIGAGYTGLGAALTLARASREVLVLEAEATGWAASSRNQGHVGINRQSFGQLADAYGKAKAAAIVREELASVDFIFDLIEREKIDCHVRRSGRFVAAARPGHYEMLAREMDTLKREVGYEADMVPRSEMRKELATDAYFGGEIRHREGSVHGAMLQAGLVKSVMAAGGTVASGTRVRRIEQEVGGFTVETPRGRIRARDVVVASDALTGNLVPKLQRRVIPLSAGGVATEPLDIDRIRSVIPGLRPSVDTLKLAHSMRPAPDHSRLIFGGRATMRDTDPRTSGERIFALAKRLFPQLDGIRLGHSWLGTVGYTFQKRPHIGQIDGIHYAVGYSGYGVAMAPYMGHKIALRLLRANDASTAFDSLPFETRPLYYGRPWFLPVTVLYYRYKDWMAK